MYIVRTNKLTFNCCSFCQAEIDDMNKKIEEYETQTKERVIIS